MTPCLAILCIVPGPQLHSLFKGNKFLTVSLEVSFLSCFIFCKYLKINTLFSMFFIFHCLKGQTFSELKCFFFFHLYNTAENGFLLTGSKICYTKIVEKELSPHRRYTEQQNVLLLNTVSNSAG